MFKAKQVIVIRKDLKMRRGKEIAQGSHGALAFLTRKLQKKQKIDFFKLSDAVQSWILDGFAKVTLQVHSEEELLKVYQDALDAGLEAHLVIDSGLTEFQGEPTKTVVCIGPDWVQKIDPVTKHLKLY